jgi:hypothetical protein
MSQSAQDIFMIIGRSDSTALSHLLAAAPDPVVARLLNMAPGHIRGRLFGAVEKDRMESAVKPLMERETTADPEKDQIVIQALGHFVGQLMQAGKIKREDDFYIGY